MANVTLSELLGAPVLDPSGMVAGRVREIAVASQESRELQFNVIVKTRHGDRMLSREATRSINGNVRASSPSMDWPEFSGSEALFLLGRDLLDQQIIDVHG